MNKDPYTVSLDESPYDVLASVGIKPDSSMQEVRDASFMFMAVGGMTPSVRRAWDALRNPATRLTVDFFMPPDHGQTPADGGHRGR